MAILQADPTLRQAITRASQCLRAGDLAGAEQILAEVPSSGDPALLHITGALRMHQQRHAEAAALFGRARLADPRAAALAFSHGNALQWLEQHAAAADAFREVIRLKPDYAEGYHELGRTLQTLGRTDEAEAVYRQWAAALPGDPRARLALGGLLLTRGRPDEAEAPLRQGIADSTDPRLSALLHDNLGHALRRQRRNQEALAVFEQAKALDPTQPEADIQRAELLQDLQRPQESAALLAGLVAREPANPRWHHLYNDLLYRLDGADYLKSYDRAPRTAELLLGKAYFLGHQKRGEEAHAAYREALALEPDNRIAAAGAAMALNMLKRHREAAQAFEAVMARHGEAPELLSCAAESAIQSGDPQKALALCERALKLAPYDQATLSNMSIALRLMQDERDEALNGYDSLIQIYELEPPQGFSSMADFNAELNGWLETAHPGTREYLNQSLRGGSQTPYQLFGAGHALVERLKLRIDEAVGRHIAALKQDDAHPLLSRRRGDFGYAGSWSSRLQDRGFHVNHIHPEGWISSCYYVAVPQAVKDEQQRQGWIKFGEPTYDVALKDPIRRAIQPAPGRLVLFPSYMWHGTVPFRDATARTTIAFDVIPL